MPDLDVAVDDPRRWQGSNLIGEALTPPVGVLKRKRGFLLRASVGRRCGVPPRFLRPRTVAEIGRIGESAMFVL
jgi:hypothetical protein